MKGNKKATLAASGALAVAALAGLFAGSAHAASTVSGFSGSSNGVSQVHLAGTQAFTGVFEHDAGTHDCKGHNECKGHGGCKTGDNGCKGKNSCKGKGGCATNH